MRKNLVLISVLSMLFIGCAAQNKVEKEDVPVEKEEVLTKDNNKESYSYDVEVKKKKVKKVKFTYYRIIPSKIETFQYRLGKNTIIDDSRLKNSFYLKGDRIRIEKIYTSKIGDRYGKIAGKNLIVSMDDLKK